MYYVQMSIYHRVFCVICHSAEEEEEETHTGAELVFTVKRRDGLFRAYMQGRMYKRRAI